MTEEQQQEWHHCAFCGKTPLETADDRWVQKNDTWICESCLKTCVEMLNEDEPSS